MFKIHATIRKYVLSILSVLVKTLEFWQSYPLISYNGMILLKSIRYLKFVRPLSEKSTQKTKSGKFEIRHYFEHIYFLDT